MKQIKGELHIDFSKEYEENDFVTVKCFTKKPMKDHPGISRKYVNDASRRIYYKSGAKRWTYSLLYWYEIKILKSELEIVPEECSLSYNCFRVKSTGQLLTNNTSGGTINGGYLNHQGEYIQHPYVLGAKDFKRLLSVAIPNEETLTEANSVVQFNGDYLEVMFLSKYANGLTNYNKSTRRYSRLIHNGDLLLNEILRSGIHNADKIIKEIFDDYSENKILMKDERKHFLENMLESVKVWKEESEKSKQWKTIPEEFIKTFESIKTF